MHWIQSLERALKPLMILFLIIYGMAYFQTDALPDSSEIDEHLYQEPKQDNTDLEPFTRTYHDKQYMIRPQFDYELYGLVVSHKDLDEKWFNIYYDNDPYNIKDICVIWGDNLKNNDFHKVSFWNQTWTCWFQHDYDVHFNHHELSNNHILPDTEEVADLLKYTKPGDQIHLKGQLVNYSLIGEGGGERRSSTSRYDKGNGACEVVFVSELTILHPANQFWRVIKALSGVLLALSVSLKTYLFVFF